MKPNPGKTETENENRSELTSTIKVDMDHLFASEKDDPEKTEDPIRLENLELNTKDAISLLTKKPPEKYQFRGSLGRGGMKVVIQVKDRDTTRDIAMALLPDAANRPPEDTLRFLEEARITASLEHPNIVPVHDIGVDDSGSPYFTMKLLRGENLASILKKIDSGDAEYMERFNLERLLRIFLKICNAVAFAHSKNVLHLDLKPENVQVGDFGEVLLMDWGLARVINDPEQDNLHSENPTQTASFRIQNEQEVLTQDGITKGTPGYMAPEQAAGLNSKKDFRTDVYALGAILYTIVTGKNPLDKSKGIAQMMRDTIRGNIVSPHERTPNRTIPTALEAVIHKAMSLRPDDRYPSAKALRDEIYAFLGGYATAAEKANMFKKTMLMLKRHTLTSIAAGIVLLLLVTICVYLVRDNSKQRGDWSQLYQIDFTEKQNMDDLSFYNSTLTMAVPEWKQTSEGLRMVRNEWIWLTGLSAGGNIRVEVQLITGAPGDSLTICLNSGLNPLKYSWYVPSGYSARIAGHSGATDLICRNELNASPEKIAAADTRIEQGKTATVIFERNQEQLKLTVNNHVLEVTDLFPLISTHPGWIGLRAEGASTILKSIQVFRMALPEKASPLIAGDTLVEARLYQEAIDKYLMLADTYGSGRIAEEALVKAYHTAATFVENKEIRQEIIQKIRYRIDNGFPKFRYREKILEINALREWKENNYHASLYYIDEIFALNPKTTVVSKILQFPHKKLPADALNGLIRYIVRSTEIRRLNISGLGITSLKQLENMKLVYLDCSQNDLTSLEGLEKMPLEVLLCQNNRLKDLSPLSNMSLRMLDCGRNKIKTLQPLDLKDMKTLIVLNNQINSLVPLKDALSLEVLEVQNNAIADLAPLSRIRTLKKLNIGKNPVVSLAPLAGIPLEFLDVNNTYISDLTPLGIMPLTTLVLTNCPRITDLSPLQTIETLETLYLPGNTTGIDSLRSLPSLLFLYEGTYGTDNTPPKSRFEYWNPQEQPEGKMN